jgi:hypothetical protein
MAPFIVQTYAAGAGGDWIGSTLTAPFANPLVGGNTLVGMSCSRGLCSTLDMTITDTQSNAWDALIDVEYSLGYSISSASGADTVEFTGANFCGLTFDPCVIATEVSGVAAFGSLVTATGTSGPATGSITTPQGTYTFTTISTGYNPWILNLLYMSGTSADTGIVLAFVYAPNTSIDPDVIPGWAKVAQNLHSSMYTMVTTPTPPATVRIFINSGASRSLAKFPFGVTNVE